MIVLHIEAESLDELKGKVFRALGMTLKDKLDMLEPEVKPTKTKTKAPKPEPQPEAVAGSFEEPVDDLPTVGETYPDLVDPEPDPEPVEATTADVIALEKLKAETMILIQDMFAAGKVKHIRAVLDKHGNGAKSFPEIEAKEFPVINAALKAA